MKKICLYIFLLIVCIAAMSCDTEEKTAQEAENPDSFSGAGECLIADPTAFLEDRLVFSEENSNCYEFILDGKDYKIFPDNYESIVNFPELMLSDKYRVTQKNSELILQLDCYVGYRESCGYFEIAYVSNSGEFIPDSVGFVPTAKPESDSGNGNTIEITDGDFTFRHYLDGLMLVEYNGNDTDISIPEESGGLPVICIGKDCFSGKSIKSVSMPSVQVIGSSAFCSCTEMKAVYAPQVRMIGSCAFEYCKALSKVSFPYALFVGTRAFDTCESLSQVDFPSLKYIGRESLFNTAITELHLPGAKIIYSEAFSNCFELRDIYIPKLEYAGSDLFFLCEKVTIHTRKGNSAVMLYNEKFKVKGNIAGVVYDQ